MNRCLNCGNDSNDENFCIKCENQNWHICEDCGEPTNKSRYSITIGGLVCEKCQSKHELE